MTLAHLSIDYISVLFTFSSLKMNQHSTAINASYFKPHYFADPQSHPVTQLEY